MKHLLRKHFFSRNILFPQQMLPRLRAEKTTLTRFQGFAWVAFPKLNLRKHLFSVKCSWFTRQGNFPARFCA